jgi:hypothetical protein
MTLSFFFKLKNLPADNIKFIKQIFLSLLKFVVGEGRKLVLDDCDDACLVQVWEDAAYTEQVPEVQQAPVGRTYQVMETVSAQVGPLLFVELQNLIYNLTAMKQVPGIQWYSFPDLDRACRAV